VSPPQPAALAPAEPDLVDPPVLAPPYRWGGRSVARNTILHLAGIGIPLAVGFALVPIIVRHLGPVRFGLLGLAWALLEYFTLFDVGLGRATTRLVAEGLVTRRPGLGGLVVVSLASQTALGALAGIGLGLIAPVLVGRVFVVPDAVVGEAVAVLRVLGAMLPFVVLGLGLRGVLEAAGRFDVSTMIRIPSSTATFALSAFGAWRGMSLPHILVMVLCARIASCIVTGVLLHRSLSALRWAGPRDWSALRPLLSYGGWIAVSNVVSPLLVYLDRFVLASVVGLAAVGYYTAPYELVSRMLVIAASLGAAIFPAVSAIAASGDARSLTGVFGASVRTLTLVMLPATAIVVAFAPDILAVWLGPAYAAHSTTALRVLTVAVLINALAYVPHAYLQALGRADLPAKFHLLELAVQIPLAWLLVHRFGVAGAAWAWAARVTFDAVLLFVAAARVVGLSARDVLAGRGTRLAMAALALCAVLAGGAVGPVLSPTRFALAAGAVVAFALLAWRFVLDADERRLLAVVLRRSG
jgi:O-antigen/teichoic acid export membrane protein